MTRLAFAYDLEKDIANFMRGTNAKNSSKPTNLQRKYLERYGEPYEEENVRALINEHWQERGFRPEQMVTYVEDKWRPIEQEFFSRADSLFGISLTKPVTAYITTNSRCTYAIRDGYFFVWFDNKSPNAVIMHELLHFYTWDAYHEQLVAGGMDEIRYNNLKESLTALLNMEFADLMNGADDTGYPQHAELRERIREEWLKSHDLTETIEVATRS